MDEIESLCRLCEAVETAGADIAHTEGVDAAKTVLNDFMNAYRYTDGSYECQATDIESLEDAVLLQKRIELWGEGLLYFDYKRLKKTVVRTLLGNSTLSICITIIIVLIVFIF
jgi:hypothetical protein